MTDASRGQGGDRPTACHRLLATVLVAATSMPAGAAEPVPDLATLRAAPANVLLLDDDIAVVSASSFLAPSEPGPERLVINATLTSTGTVKPGDPHVARAWLLAGDEVVPVPATEAWFGDPHSMRVEVVWSGHHAPGTRVDLVVEWRLSPSRVERIRVPGLCASALLGPAPAGACETSGARGGIPDERLFAGWLAWRVDRACHVLSPERAARLHDDLVFVQVAWAEAMGSGELVGEAAMATWRQSLPRCAEATPDKLAPLVDGVADLATSWRANLAVDRSRGLSGIRAMSQVR